MESRLKTTEELLGILLNFLVVLSLETALDAALGGSSAPVYGLCLLLAAPLIFYAARRFAGNFVLFMLIHIGVVAALFYAAGYLPVSLLWRIVFLVLGAVYAVASVKGRLSRKDNGEEELAPAFAAGVALVSFLVCSHMQSDVGCERVLWLALLWLPGYFIRDYLDNFLAYVDVNRKSAGVMPEKKILRGGIVMVAGYGIFCLTVLMICTKTPLVSWMSGLVRSIGIGLLHVLGWLLSGLPQGEEEEIMTPDSTPQLSEGMPMQKPLEPTPVWVEIMNQVIITTVTLAVIVGLIILIVLLVRNMIRSFYGRKPEKKEIHEEGFIEEEERLSRRVRKEKTRLPILGGTPAQRVRRIFKKTVREGYPDVEPGAFLGKTARELAFVRKKEEPAGLLREEKMAQASAGNQDFENAWEELAGVYERARYTAQELTGEDVREAGKLSREILHSIK